MSFIEIWDKWLGTLLHHGVSYICAKPHIYITLAKKNLGYLYWDFITYFSCNLGYTNQNFAYISFPHFLSPYLLPQKVLEITVNSEVVTRCPKFIDWPKTTLNTSYTMGSSILWIHTFVYHILIYFKSFHPYWQILSIFHSLFIQFTYTIQCQENSMAHSICCIQCSFSPFGVNMGQFDTFMG